MLSKRYESTKVDCRTWLHVLSGTHWSTSSDTHQVVEIQIETSTKTYTPYTCILLRNMKLRHFMKNLLPEKIETKELFILCRYFILITYPTCLTVGLHYCIFVKTPYFMNKLHLRR